MYQVSNLGRVRSLDRLLIHKNGYRHFKKGKVLKPSIGTTGYYHVNLCKNGHKSAKIHRLVANAFLTPACNKTYINHIDGNPLNNKSDNLEWCTQKENVIHAYKIGLHKTKRVNVDKDLLIEMYQKRKDTRNIANELGISISMVYAVLRENGVKIRTGSEARSKYNLDLDKLREDFENGMRNKDIAKKYNCSIDIIATRKYRLKKEGALL